MGARLRFHGASGMVTGSHLVLDTGLARIGVDAGLFQGPRELEELNRRGFGHRPGELDALVLTHAHLDHSGRLPLLAKEGFKGPVLSTGATRDLSDLMLRDSARLMEEEAERGLRHPDQYDAGFRPGPLFTEHHVEETLRLFRIVDYGRSLTLAGGLDLVMRDAGHILGSATLELRFAGRKLVVSGDLGRHGSPILRDPEVITEADWLVVESTYGDREHADKAGRGRRLFSIVKRAVDSGGNVVIPAFTVGRTQDILYELNPFFESREMPRISVFVDSPMAISAGEIYRRHLECYDPETRALLARGDDPLRFPGLVLTRTRDESKQINSMRQPHIVIAGNGMCTGGRVVHHLAQNLGREESTVLLVGYQAEGTLGRRLRDGAKTVRIFGREFDVRAKIEVMDAFSAHADRSELLEWLGGFKKFPKRVFLVHGEPASSASLASAIRQRFGAEVTVPRLGDEYGLE